MGLPPQSYLGETVVNDYDVMSFMQNVGETYVVGIGSCNSYSLHDTFNLAAWNHIMITLDQNNFTIYVVRSLKSIAIDLM